MSTRPLILANGERWVAGGRLCMYLSQDVNERVVSKNSGNSQVVVSPHNSSLSLRISPASGSSNGWCDRKHGGRADKMRFDTKGEIY